jgi:hypothetical protein
MKEGQTYTDDGFLSIGVGCKFGIVVTENGDEMPMFGIQFDYIDLNPNDPARSPTMLMTATAARRLATTIIDTLDAQHA